MFTSFQARTHVNYEVQEDVAVIKFDAPNSKVNDRWIGENIGEILVKKVISVIFLYGLNFKTNIQ